MVKVQLDKAEDRGYAEHGGWLESYHSFSFADWYEPTKMGFGTLRVINDDIIGGNNGFGAHPHRDMEIVTIPLEGVLTHKDSMGNTEDIVAGDVQRMSAGTGIIHSEINHADEPVKSFQIWIETRENGIKPSYAQKRFDKSDRKNKFQLVVSPDGRDGSININQDAYFSLIDLENDMSVEYKKYLDTNGVYLMVIEGEVEIDKHKLSRRDAIGIEDLNNIRISSLTNSKLLIIEVPMK